jgi:integrase
MKCVRKVKRRGQPRWVLDIRYRTPAGVPKRFRRDAQVQTRAAATAEAKRLLARLAVIGTLENDEVEVVPIIRTVGAAVEHFELVELPKKKPSTRRGYGVIIETEIKPRYASTVVEELTKEAFIRLDTELVEAGQSPSTRRNILVVLRRILRSVVDAGWLERMPDLPPLPRVGRKIARAMSWKESEAILKSGNPAFQLAGLLARDAGLRAGEVRGLRWSDLDLAARTLTVRRAICCGVAAPPKSGHERVVPLTEQLFAAISSSKGKRRSPWGPVAPNTLGRVWSESGLRSAFKLACERAGVIGWRLHDLRHLFVTSLFKAGAAAPTVQQLAGHELLTTTQLYSHTDADACRAAIAALGTTRSN